MPLGQVIIDPCSIAGQTSMFFFTGKTHGGLHFPKDRVQYTGVVAEIDQKLQAEIAEWQKRMQEYLVEVAMQQQQMADQQQQQQQSSQNGAQQQEDHHHIVSEDTEENSGQQQPLARSSSQQRE